MEFLEDTQTDADIRDCINKRRCFSVVAGAGSGKTTSLIKALVYIRQVHGGALRVADQQVACITYTNAAVDVIKQRTSLDELFHVSTIHSFLWDLVKGYQSDIRVMLERELIPQRIERQQERDRGGQSRAAIRARERVVELTRDMGNLPTVKHFTYGDGSRRDYSAGRLDHDDVIDLASTMIKESPILRMIIGQRYPYIFVDEAQDTFHNVMESLNMVAQPEGLPIIGYFGDPMQQIYDDNRAGEFKGPEGAVVVTKPENYRCSTEVINLLNAIRPELQQMPGSENVGGSVEIRLVQAEKGTGPRNTYSPEQLSRSLSRFDEALEGFGWAGRSDVKQLFLTWQMIAHRLGFSELNRLFTGRYASRSTADAFKKGEHFALQPFMEVLVPLMEAVAQSDYVTMTRIMRQYSPILDPKGVNELVSVKQVRRKVQAAIDALSRVWADSSIRDILAVAQTHGLVEVSARLGEHLARSRRVEEYDAAIHSQDKGDWLMDEYLDLPTNELSTYRDFVLEATPFGTQHGAKGEQYERVLVVFDDTEADWRLFSFSRLLTPTAAGRNPTEGQRKRSLNLAYVCFSRAVRDLRIILFTENPLEAKAELVEQGYFAEHQIGVQ